MATTLRSRTGFSWTLCAIALSVVFAGSGSAGGPGVGDQAPAFEAPDAEGKTINLEQFR